MGLLPISLRPDQMPPADQSQETRVALLESRFSDLCKVVESIDGSLSALVKLETHHTETRASLERAFKSIKAVESDLDNVSARVGDIERAMPKDFDERFRAIENAMPGLQEIRRWVIAGVMGIVALVGAAVLGVVLSG